MCTKFPISNALLETLETELSAARTEFENDTLLNNIYLQLQNELVYIQHLNL